MNSSLSQSLGGAIGIHIDGKEITIAHVAKIRDQLRIVSLQKLTLSIPFEGLSEKETGAFTVQSSQDVFGGDLESAVAGIVETTEISEDDNNLLLSALQQLPLKKCRLGYSIPSANVRFFNAGEYGGSEKTNAIVDRIRKEAEEKIGEVVTINNSHVEVQSTAPAWCIIHRNGIKIINRLEQMRPALGNVRIRHSLVDPVEVILIGVLNREWPAKPNEVTVQIHIGPEFTHLLFLRGREVITVAPLIQTGANSPTLLQTLVSKILLEQDEANITEIHRIALSGCIYAVGAIEYFERRYPDVEIRELSNANCDDSFLSEEERAIQSDAIIAIGLAVKILNPEGFWKSNLLPTAIRRSQRTLNLAWHGYVLLITLFISSLFITFLGSQYKSELRRLRLELLTKQSQDLQNQMLRRELDSLTLKISEMQNLLLLSDSLSRGAHRWSQLLQVINTEGKKIPSIWFESIQSGKDGITIMGKTLNRNSVSKASKLFPNTVIQRINRVTVQNRILYQFEFKVPYPNDDVPSEKPENLPATQTESGSTPSETGPRTSPSSTPKEGLVG
ncbi:MAG: hypothetical protein N2450_02265 [bacterium]|nr:hypothetical protein [bacterium]